MARRGGGSRGRRLPKAVDRELWDQLIEHAAIDRREPLLGLRDEAILALFFFSGLRCAELVGLDVRDTDLQRGRVNVRHGKGDKERTPAVSALALDLIEAYLDVRPDPKAGTVGNPLFISRKGGRLSTSGVRRLVDRVEQSLPAEIRDRLPAKGLHPHAFRHSHITQIVRQASAKGKNIFEVAEQAGHADLRTTRLYYAASDAERQQLVEDL